MNTLALQVLSTLFLVALTAWGVHITTSAMDWRKRLGIILGLICLGVLCVVTSWGAFVSQDRDAKAREAAIQRADDARARDIKSYFDKALGNFISKTTRVTHVVAVKPSETQGKQLPPGSVIVLGNPLRVEAKDMGSSPVAEGNIGGKLTLEKYVQPFMNIEYSSDVDGVSYDFAAVSVSQNTSDAHIKAENGKVTLEAARRAEVPPTRLKPEQLHGVDARVGYWFTLRGPIFTQSKFQDFINKKVIVYFAGTVHLRSGGHHWYRAFCYMNAGDPNVIIQCPGF